MNASIKNAAASATASSKAAWASTLAASQTPVAKDLAVTAAKAGIATIVVLAIMKTGEALGI